METVFTCPSALQAELQQERHEHEQTLATMKEEEKLRVDRMAHDLEIKWTENLRYAVQSQCGERSCGSLLKRWASSVVS